MCFLIVVPPTGLPHKNHKGSGWKTFVAEPKMYAQGTKLTRQGTK